MDPRSDIERILDLIIADSSFVNQPEEHKAYWDAMREAMDDEQIKIMNHYRQRIGLEPA
jgi:hypothetical protein